jgi:pilus assembly protein FimV
MSSSTNVGRFALSAVAAAALCAASSTWALGLGRLAVQSALGEPLRAEIDVTSLTSEEAGSLRVRVAASEAYRAAGVDYNAVLSGTQVTLARRADGRPYLRLVSDRVVLEPFVDVILEMNWASGRLVREYTLLFDPPAAARAPAPAPAPPPRPRPSRARRRPRRNRHARPSLAPRHRARPQRRSTVMKCAGATP